MARRHCIHLRISSVTGVSKYNLKLIIDRMLTGSIKSYKHDTNRADLRTQQNLLKSEIIQRKKLTKPDAF